MKYLTTAEESQLRALYGKAEKTRVRALEAEESLDAYIEHLLANGRDANRIIAATIA